MSDAEDDFRFFGTPLEPYDEDAFPKKRPITVEEQTARDAQGRRRFHGAFTGGFSAGFYNTVGSLEGWRPQEFKSSRGEKAQNVRQKPEDFMDDEDMGEFGIAPQVVQATSDYSSGGGKKRKRPAAFNEGPIPGEPVLESLLQAGNETVGYFLMKNINKKHRSRQIASGPKVYGCQMPRDTDITVEPDDFQYEVHEIYATYLAQPKINSFGLGYVGLSRIFGSESQSAHLSGVERNNKKFSIAGQAFGVGAFEDEDDDIYVKDDMSKYDFEMTTENASKKGRNGDTRKVIFDIFYLSAQTANFKNVFPPPTIPNSFTGKHKTKKSRFEPVAVEKKVTERKDMNAAVRAGALGERTERNPTPSNQQHRRQPREEQVEIKEEKPKNPIFPGLILDRFVSAQVKEDTHDILEVVAPSESEHGTKEMKDAVKLKMFGPLTHSFFDWQPHSFLCRRFNVPEPNTDGASSLKPQKRTKNLIFEYQKHIEDSASLQPGLSVTTEPQTPPLVPKEEPIDVPVVSDDITSNISTEGTIPNLPLSEQQPSQVASLEPEKLQNPDENAVVIDVTQRLDIAKNVDLFKSVFLSSDEESEQEEEEETQQQKSRETEKVVFEPLIPVIKTKEGILSNLDFTKLKPKEEKVEDEAPQPPPDVYGPILPVVKVATPNLVTVVHSVDSDDEWVEKGSSNEKAKKRDEHERKHKCKRHKKEKKHKHKSKR